MAKRVFFGTGDSVVALDASTGAKLWTYDTGEQTGNGDVAYLLVAGNLVFFFDRHDNSVYALDPERGSLRWKVGGIVGITGMYLEGGTLFVNQDAVQDFDALYAVDVATGRLLWQKAGMGGRLAFGANTVYVAQSIPTSDALPVTDGFVAALAFSDGKQLWKVTGHAFGDLMLSSGVLYSTDEGVVYAYEASTGATMWSKQVGTFVSLERLVGTTLYTSGSSASAMDVTTQNVLWSIPTQASHLVASGSILCVRDLDTLYGVDSASGAQRWKLQSTDGFGSLVGDDGACYADATTESRSPLSAYDAQTGTLRWQKPITGIYNEVLQANGMLYMLADATTPGKTAVIAISSGSGAQVWEYTSDQRFPGSLAIG